MSGEGRRRPERGGHEHDDCEELRLQLDAERRMAALTRRFLALELDEIEEGLQEALAAAAREAGADRAQITWIYREGPGPPTLERHIWAAPGVPPIVEDEAPARRFPWIRDQLLAGRVVNVPRVADLPDEAAAERERLLEIGDVSYLGVPIVWRGQLAGSLDVRCATVPRTWSDFDVERLKLMGEVLLSVLRRRDAQMARREAADRFDAMADNVLVALVESDADGRIVYASPRLPELLGHPLEDTIGTRLVDLVHPDDRELARLSEPADDASDGGTHSEFRAAHRDGSWREVEALARPYDTGSGQRRYITLLRDVSEQTARNRELEQRLRLESLLSELSRRILSADASDVDGLVREGLEAVSHAAFADRAFLMSLPEMQRGQPYFFEWFREGAVASSTPDAGVADRYRGFTRRLQAGETVSVPDVAALDDEFAVEREAMLASGIRSYLLVPATSRSRLVGVLGVHCVLQQRDWSEHDITLLRLVADLFIGALRRKRNERALAESEARFRAMAEHSQDSICELSSHGRILYASPAFERLVGRPQSQLEGGDFFELSHPEDSEPVAGLIEAALAGVVDRAVVFRIRSADDWIDVEATARGYAAGLDEPRLVTVLRDVSDRERDRRILEKQIEGEQEIAALSRFFLDLDATRTREAIESKLAVAAKLAGAERAWLYSIDPRGEEPVRRCGWTAPGFDLAFPTGEHYHESDWAFAAWSQGQVVQIPRLADLPPERREQMQGLEDRGVRSFLGVPLLSGGQFMGLMSFEVLTRERSWSNEQVTLLHLVGEVFVSALRREQAEAELEHSQMQLLQSQKMEAVGTLAGGIAHDFNNHLAVMLGNARFIGDNNPTADPDMRDALDDIQRSAEHCAQLTRSLLAFSRRSPVTIRAVPVGEIVETVSDLVRPLLPSSISFRAETQDPQDAVRADPTQLRQVLINLVVNARDAMPSGGRLSVGARRRSLGEREARAIGLPLGDYVEISVRDDGEGMTETIRARVFEPFFTTKELGQGTGLGLATAYGIVQQLGGSMEVESEPGRGTIFRVMLPLSEPESPVLEMAASEDPGEGTETLLLVEDEPAVRRLLCRTLRSRGFSVIEAADGLEGLAAAERAGDEIDLVISDLVMPRMGGMELAAKLQVQRPELRVLFLSGHAGPKDAGEPKAVQGARFLQKPFRDDDLLREVRHLLEIEAAPADDPDA